ncbi:hypothetical protein DFJ74DRAFT_681809 [Hyaloraphidium curvatum]|nr:hypothetical protein DFJ74DRAFT_681809 [Hyaloraphidium curvatum]
MALFRGLQARTPSYRQPCKHGQRQIKNLSFPRLLFRYRRRPRPLFRGQPGPRVGRLLRVLLARLRGRRFVLESHPAVARPAPAVLGGARPPFPFAPLGVRRRQGFGQVRGPAHESFPWPLRRLRRRLRKHGLREVHVPLRRHAEVRSPNLGRRCERPRRVPVLQIPPLLLLRRRHRPRRCTRRIVQLLFRPVLRPVRRRRGLRHVKRVVRAVPPRRRGVDGLHDPAPVEVCLFQRGSGGEQAGDQRCPVRGLHSTHLMNIRSLVLRSHRPFPCLPILRRSLSTPTLAGNGPSDPGKAARGGATHWNTISGRAAVSGGCPRPARARGSAASSVHVPNRLPGSVPASVLPFRRFAQQSPRRSRRSFGRAQGQTVRRRRCRRPGYGA